MALRAFGGGTIGGGLDGSTIAGDVADRETVIGAAVATAVEDSVGAVSAKRMGADPTGATSCVALVNSLLQEHDHVILTQGDYLADASFILNRSNVRLTIDESASITVASAFTESLFLIDGQGSSIRGARVDGGGVVRAEGKSGGATTVPADWTAVEFRAAKVGAGSSCGTTVCTVSGVQFQWPNRLVKFTAGPGGWCNGNGLMDVRCLYPRIYVESDFSTSEFANSHNFIDNVMGQSGNHTTHGVKALSGRDWNFNRAMFWDLPSASTGLEVNADARSVTITDGFLGSTNVVNNAPEGEVRWLERYQQPPWLLDLPVINAGSLIPNTTRASVPTLSTHTSHWPMVVYADAQISSAGCYWKVPPRVLQAKLRIHCVGMGVSGTARFVLTTQTVIGGSTNTRTNDVALTSDTVTTYDTDALIGLTPGTLIRIDLQRAGTNAADVLTGSVGVLAIEPIAIKGAW